MCNSDRGRGWSWVHVTDLADAYCRIAEQSELDKELFCIADQEQPRCANVARAAAKAAHFIPMHYATFDLSDEPMSQPLKDMYAAARHGELNNQLTMLGIGQPLISP